MMLLLAIALFLWAHCNTALGSPDALNFLLLGDWGKGGTTGSYGNLAQHPGLDEAALDSEQRRILKQNKVLYQMQVATSMGTYSAHADPAPSFVVALGDNFYDNGVYSSTDANWDYLWKDVYLGFEGLNIPWYPVFGNHDYGYGATGVKAQTQRYHDHTDDDIWMFESTNYTKTFNIPGADGGTVCVVFIDTTTLAPSVNRCCNKNGGISEEVQQERIADQLGRIESALNATLADPPSWLLVVGHYPIFSASSNGDVSELQQYLLPLLKKYRVHAYICGHDHIAEHLRYKDYDTEFFVVGAGSMVDTVNEAKSIGELIWAGPSYASFAAVNATARQLTISYYDTDTELRYSYTLDNPLRPSVSPDPRPGPDPGPDPPAGGNGDSYTGHKGPRSPLSWAYWQQTTSNKKFAMASGFVAMAGLMLLICHMGYHRHRKHQEKLAKDSFLAKARAARMVTSPTGSRGRLRAHRAHTGSGNYVELMEQGEAGSRHDSQPDEDTDSDDDEIAALKARVRNNSGSSPAKADYAAMTTTVPTTAESTAYTELLEFEPAGVAAAAHSRSTGSGSFSPQQQLSPPSPQSAARFNTPTHSSKPSDVSAKMARIRANTNRTDQSSPQSTPPGQAQRSRSNSRHQTEEEEHSGGLLTPEQAALATTWLSRTATRTPSPSPPAPTAPTAAAVSPLPLSPHSRRPSNASHTTHVTATSARPSPSPSPSPSRSRQPGTSDLFPGDTSPPGLTKPPLGIAEAGQTAAFRVQSPAHAYTVASEHSPVVSELSSASPIFAPPAAATPSHRPPMGHRRTTTAPP